MNITHVKFVGHLEFNMSVSTEQWEEKQPYSADKLICPCRSPIYFYFVGTNLLAIVFPFVGQFCWLLEPAQY